MTSHAENCSLQVFFMASQIDECDHFWRPWIRKAFFNQIVKIVKIDSFQFDILFTNTNPIQVAVLGSIYDITRAVKAQNIVAYWRGSAWFSLMFVPEQPLTGKATTVIQFTMSQDSKQSGFSSIHVPNDSTTDLVKVLKCMWTWLSKNWLQKPNEHFLKTFFSPKMWA